MDGVRRFKDGAVKAKAAGINPGVFFTRWRVAGVGATDDVLQRAAMSIFLPRRAVFERGINLPFFERGRHTTNLLLLFPFIFRFYFNRH
jgi:hypothetical protein